MGYKNVSLLKIKANRPTDLRAKPVEALDSEG